MSHSTVEEIRQCFSQSEDFNQIFDAFESAIRQSVNDIELYKQLFSNRSLTPDEVRLFGEKLAVEFPGLAFDIFFWLAKVFEATYALSDNYELAFRYFQKATKERPLESAPYIDASGCYDPDLNIPPIEELIQFLKSGIEQGANPALLYARLAHLHELAGDPVQAEYCRRQAEQAREQ